MKAILEFDLPEDNYQYKAAIQGADLKLIVATLDNMLRGYLKYGHDFQSANDAIQSIRNTLNEDLQAYSVHLNDE